MATNDPTDLTQYPVPSTSFVPTSRNASDLDKLVNGGNTVITNRAGNALPSYEKAIADARIDYGAFVPTGPYQSGGFNYTVNMLFDEGDTTYLVLKNFTSTDFATDSAIMPALFTVQQGIIKSDAVYNIESVSDLQGLDLTNIESIYIAGYHAGSNVGGGIFSKSIGRHNGGTFIDPTRTFPTDWTDQSQLTDWFADSGVDELCIVRDTSNIHNLKWFGAKGDAATNDTIPIKNTIKASLKKSLFAPEGTYIVSDEFDIIGQLTIIGDTQGNSVFQKTTGVNIFNVLSPNVKLSNIKLNGGILGDTSSGIRIGQNDGAGGQGEGYISAAQCTLEDVFINDCGNRGVDWQEGPFCIFNNVHSFDAKENNFYVSPDAFDASHGKWYTNSAGAGSDGYSINFGIHVFVHAKSFSDSGRGMYLNNSRGSVGNIMVELSGSACLEFGSDTLANKITLQFWTSGKNYVDNGIGNKVSGMSLGDNNGGFYDSYTRTSQLLIKKELVQDGDTVLEGGLGISQSSNEEYTMGNSVYPCNINSDTAGLAFKAVAVHPRVFDLGGFGTTNSLNSGNVYVGSWLLSDGQTLQLNGDGGNSYAPFDGQTVIVFLKGNGTCSINGVIGGSFTTVNITTPNGSLKFMWQSSQNSWFESA